MPKTPSRASGFSLVELVITVTIAGILTAIAIPSFSSVISNNRLTTYSNDFVGALNLARSEAIKRGSQVTVKRLGPTAKEWQWGWDVFVDINADKIFNDNADANLCEVDSSGAAQEDCLLRTYTESPNAIPPVLFLPNGFTLISNSNIADAIGFTAMGKSTGNGTLFLCDTNRPDNPAPPKSDRLKSAKIIIITSTGRVRMGVDSDHDGRPERDAGTNISNCNTP
jgi:type IV fimbrial biogenesis protein FimT